MGVNTLLCRDGKHNRTATHSNDCLRMTTTPPIGNLAVSGAENLITQSRTPLRYHRGMWGSTKTHVHASHMGVTQRIRVGRDEACRSTGFSCTALRIAAIGCAALELHPRKKHFSCSSSSFHSLTMSFSAKPRKLASCGYLIELIAVSEAAAHTTGTPLPAPANVQPSP